MSKIKTGKGITKALFGLGKKEMKVIPFNQMTRDQFDQLDRFLGRLGAAQAMGSLRLTKAQQNYFLNQVKQLDLYRKRILNPPEKDAFIKAYEEVMAKVRTGAPLNPSDKAKLEAAGFKPNDSKDLFKGFEPKVIEGGKGETPFTDMVQKEIGDVKLYGDETFDELEFIRKNKRHPRDEKAKGGLVNLIKKFLKKSKPKKSGDKIYGVGGEEIDVADLKKSLGLDEATDKKSMEDLEKKLQMIMGRDRTKHVKGGLIAAVKKLNKKYGKGTIKKAKDMKRPKKAIEKEELEQLFKSFKKKYGFAGGGVAHMLGYAEGDRVPAFKGGLMKLLKAMGENNPAQAYRKYLASVKRRSQEGDFKSLAPELGAVAGGGILANRALTRKLKEISQQERDAFYDRLASEYKEKYRDDPEMLRIMLEGLEKRRQEKPVRGMYSEGGMSRRTFLKIMGAIAAFPVVGKFFKGAKVATKVPPMVTQTKDMPAHFPKLVEKILKEGKIVSAEKSGFIKKYQHPTRKDIEMEIQGDGDQISITFETDQGAPGYYEYRKGDIIEEGKFAGQREGAEFREAEELGKMNPDGDVDTDVMEFIDTGTENLDEFVGMSKQPTSKSKIILQDPEYSKGGVAGLLGE